MFPGIPEIVTEESVFENGDALLEEIKHFVHCIKTGENPLVSGEAGRKALSTAIEITKYLTNRQGVA
jgi:predicted dehydrogenase